MRFLETMRDCEHIREKLANFIMGPAPNGRAWTVHQVAAVHLPFEV
jgi:hypothetical protein